ncbi:MAG: hypothetical protein GY856_50925 [bacterium]|nr:hypothetical protein [bacterium]
MSDRPQPEAAEAPRRSVYLVSAVLCCGLLALPFLLVTIPPITDLPQQTAQIRLLFEALGDESGPYLVQWLHPNKLGYLPLAACWGVAGPLAAGRMGLLVIALLWAAAIHALAHARGRRPAAAVVATLFFFNHTTYWGFLNCLIGLPVFVLWFLFERRLGGAVGWRDGLRLCLAAALLYSAHVLWLAAGLIWLLAAAWVPRPGKPAIRQRLTRVAQGLAWVSPVLMAVALWYPRLVAAGGDIRTFPGRPPFERLHPGWLLGSAFGGLQGKVEWMLALAVVGWLLLGLWQNRTRLGQATDRRLLLAGLVFALAALTLPEVHRHTIFFASRWTAPAAVFGVLALPPPRLRPLAEWALPWLLFAALITATANRWVAFERDELTGLEESLIRLPSGQRVLGLELVRTSPRIKGFPYYHLYAWAQVLHGGELNRSFADEGSSLVVFRDLPHEYPWTGGLDWRPRRLRLSDVPHFDYAIIHGDSRTHARFAADPKLIAVTTGGAWRLYRVAAPQRDPGGGQ